MKVIKMTVDTILRISSRWQERHIKTVIKQYVTTKGNVHVKGSKTILNLFNFTFKYKNRDKDICVQPNYQNPLGSCTIMSMHCDENNENVEIMTKIAKVFGGYLTESDSTNKCELFDGMFDTEDNIPYFLEYAILNKEMTTKDLVALNKSIHKWYDRVDPNCHKESKMKLFDLEKKRKSE